MSSERLPFDETFLKEKLKSDPTTWDTRRQLAQGLYNKQAYEEAAEIIWTSDQIPSTDLDLAFAVRILAKAQPRRAIRLLTAVLELNIGKAVQNMAMANALLHHGMVLQAARFYGAALDADPTLVNPDLEHFILWSDDECTMWGLFEKARPKLGELPWMIRDPKEALRLTARVSLHTTPISVPMLPPVAGEELKHDLYQQEAVHNAKITPPPAVTIPIDRVDPKDRLFDETYGAVVSSTPAAEPISAPVVTAAPESVPIAAPAPVPVIPTEHPSAFPARVVFPESPKPAALFVPAATLVTPASPIFPPAPTPFPVAALAMPGAPPEPSAPPVSDASPEPAVIPFFADLTPPATAAPSPAAAPFFADPTPPPENPSPKAFSFLGDDRLTGSVKIPAPPSTPSATIPTQETKSITPEAEKPDTIKKAAIPEAFPISMSGVPTTLLRVKWSTAPARPGNAPATPPVAAPIPVPAPVAPPMPFAPPVAAPIPFAQPVAAPIPVAPPMPVEPQPIPFVQPIEPQPIPIPAATLTPIALPVAQQEAPIPIPLPVASAMTGAPTRALLPSGAPPVYPNGAPTRALLPSGTPPENATGAPRRLLLTPARQSVSPPTSNEGQ